MTLNKKIWLLSKCQNCSNNIRNNQFLESIFQKKGELPEKQIQCFKKKTKTHPTMSKTFQTSTFFLHIYHRRQTTEHFSKNYNLCQCSQMVCAKQIISFH